MKTKKSKFSKRIIALFLSVVMVCSSFVGVMQAYATVGTNRADKASSLGKNWIDWVDTLSDDACEALLDAADEWLKDLNLTHLAEGTLPLEGSYNAVVTTINYYVYLGNQTNSNGKKYYKNTSGCSTTQSETTDDVGDNRVYLHVSTNDIYVTGYVDSVDGIIDLLRQLKYEVLDNASILGINLVGTLAGDQVKNLNWTALTSGTLNTYDSNVYTYSKCGYSWRTKNSAKDIIKALLKFLDDNIYQRTDSNNLIYALLNGSLSLGALDGMVGLYAKDSDPTKGILGKLGSGSKIDLPSGYQSNGQKLLYNLLVGILANKTDWFADDTITFSNGVPYINGTQWNYDDVLMSKLSTELLQKINANITYENMIPNPDYDATTNPTAPKFIHDSSVARYRSGRTNDSSLPGYDANVKYTPDGNIYLFQYEGETPLTLAKTDTLYAFAMKALKLAWKTALKPTLNLLQVNFNGNESLGHGTNFDNAFATWWMEDNYAVSNGIFTDAAYTQANFDAFCAARYESYGASDAAEFAGWVEDTYNYEYRYAKKDKMNWRDVDATRLWNEVRYSPLADKIFDIQTGPLNLYFLQTGASAIEAYMDGYNYNVSTSIPEALNDFLVAATADLFPTSDNIGIQTDATGAYTSVDVPTFVLTNNAWNAATLMSNIYKALEYVAITTDANLLTEYYAKNDISGYGEGGNITSDEELEQALVAFGIAALKQWNLTAVIHDSDWDKVNDLETAAVVALHEYMGYLFPERDYSSLWSLEANPQTFTNAAGETVRYKYIDNTQDQLYDAAILPMARDAVAYVCVAAGVPVTKLDTNRTPWDPYTMGAVAASGVTAETGSDSTIWALADAVGCYFLGDMSETFDKQGTNAKAKGIGVILGLADSSGKSTIKSSANVWTNLNLIVNRVLPVAGELQKVPGASSYKGSGNFDASAFIQDELIQDVRDFNLTNLLTGVYNICASTPIKSTGVDKLVYFKVLAPLLNAILGANAGNSGSADALNTTDNASPFDRLLTSAEMVTKNNYRGVLQMLIHNLYLYFTGSTSENFYYAATFALCTLGMPGQLQAHELDGVDIKVYDTDLYSTSAKTTVKIKNNSYGLNRFYHNQGDLNSSRQYEASRYWVNVKSAYIKDASGTNKATLTSSTVSLAPEKNVYYTPSWTATRDTLYKVYVTYDILYDNTLANGTATTPAAPSTTIASNQVATKWIYVTPTSYTQQWKHQADATFSGDDFATKDGAYTGSVTTGTAANNLQLVAGSMYDVPATDVAGEGYGVRITNSSSAATGKFYVYPSVGTAYTSTSGASATVSTAAAGQVFAFLAIDEEGYIYDKDGFKYGKYDDIKSSATWLIGAHKTTNLDGDEIYDYILANAWSTPAEVAFGAPGAGTVITDCTSLAANEDTNIKLFKSGSTMAAKYTVGFAFATSASARAVVTPITLAYLGDMDSLNWAVEHYTDFSSCTSEVQAGAKAISIRYRNSTNVDAWVNADALAKAIYDAGEAEAQTRAATITAMNEDRDGLEQVDYKVIGFEKFVDVAQYAENLREAKAIVEEDANGDPVLDKDGNEIPVLDSKGRPTYEYKCAEPTWKIAEAVRQAGLYKTYMEARPHTLTRVVEELAHATTVCDEYDQLSGTGYTVNDFTATPTTAERSYYYQATSASGDKYVAKAENESVSEYRFLYSTKDIVVEDNVKVYEISTSLADGAAVKFGKVEGGKLVNDGFTTESWNAYIDALGEVITSINNSEEISKTYTATSHLVMAENELEPEEPSGGDITISGKVVIAADSTGAVSEYGLRGVVVAALDGNGNVIAQTVSDASASDSTWGDFTLVVPEGTTSFVVGDPTNADTIINREFTIAGTDDVTGAVVAVVMCDYNDDGVINSMDKAEFNGYYKGDYSVYADFNDDGIVNAMDKAEFNGIYKTCSNGPTYSALTF